MKTISKKDFDKIITNEGRNAVIEFYAPWCEPCAQMADILDELKEQNKKL